MPWRTLTPPDTVELALSQGAGGLKYVVLVGWSVGRLTVRRSLLMLGGGLRDGRVTMFCFVRGYGRRRPWCTTVSPTRWMPFLLRPVHAWLARCWPACVWSVYLQVAAAAAVWLVRGCLGRLMVGLVCVGSVALLPVVASPNIFCVAGTSMSVPVTCVLVCPSVV